MKKQILGLIILLGVLLGSYYFIDKNRKKEEDIHIITNNNRNEEESDKDKDFNPEDPKYYFEDSHFLYEEENLVIRLRERDFIYGLAATDAGFFWNYEAISENKYQVIDLDQETIDSYQEHEYQWVKDVFPDGLTFTVEDQILTLHHPQKEQIFIYKEVNEIGGR